ncbi:MAG: hypothetical protein H7Y38_12215 [Armatimonadetes bacterium]|nr:hypothetical protein [Armatimonadota bacterium]
MTTANTTPNIPPDGTIVRAVTLATRRLRQRRALKFGATGFLLGSVVGLGVAALITYDVLRETTLPGGAAFLFLPTLAGLLAGVSYGVLGKYDPVAVARLLEKRLDLKDRLSTALAKPAGEAHISAAQESDAQKYVPGDAEVFRAVPLSPVPRRVYVAGAVALSVLLMYFAPELPVFWNPTIRAERAVVKKEGEKLLAVAKAAAKEAKKKNLPEAEAAAKKVEALGKEMARGRMPLQKAMAERAKLAEDLQKAQAKIARDEQSKADQKTKTSLGDAGRDLSKAMQGSSSAPGASPLPGSADARMKALQDAMAKGDKNAAANALREMADAADRGEPAPGGERDKTGRQLAALGDSLQKNDLSEAGQSAQNAGQSMSQNAMPEAAQSLRDAADKLEQAGANEKSANGSQEQSKPGEQSGQSGKSGQQGSSSQQGQQSQSGQQGGQSSQSQGADSRSEIQKAIDKLTGKDQRQQAQQQQGQSGSQGQQGQSGQSAGGQKPGQGQGKSGQSGSQGQGQGKGAGQKGSGGKSGSSGAGSGSSGGAKTGEEAQRLSKGAREQNVKAKVNGTGPETVITERDTDRSGLPVSSLPYYKEFVKGRTSPASESAQTGDSVPNAYRDQVRGYFDERSAKGSKP